jgi:hypothetical protein
MIVLSTPPIRASLQHRPAIGWVGGDFGLIDPVHLFVGGVVLWMSWAAIVDLNSQSPPPDGQARESPWAGPAERRSVIHTDRPRQTVATEDALQGWTNGFIGLVGHQPDI